MEVIPALDLKGERAVRGAGGDRRRYRPVDSPLARRGDPLALARAFRDRLGLRGCYVADLDALAGEPPRLSLLRRLAAEGLRVWVDAGVQDAAGAARVLEAGAARAVVGLETLPEPAALAAIAAAHTAGRLAFSLDLRDGRPVTAAAALRKADPVEVAGLARDHGFRTQIVLDLSRVGSLSGPPWDLLGAIRSRYPDLALVAGGGIRHGDDLRELARLGLAAALVATALHRGRITLDDVEAVSGLTPGTPGSGPPGRRTPPPPR